MSYKCPFGYKRPSKIQLAKRIAWVKALRSGEFKQAMHFLFDGVGYCCLGFGCKIIGQAVKHIENPKIADDTGYDLSGYFFGNTKDRSTSQFTNYAAKMYGFVGSSSDYCEHDPVVIYNEVPYELSRLNDMGVTFEVIADLIEKQHIIPYLKATQDSQPHSQEKTEF